MNILYVIAHPNPDSFNAMLKQHALNFLTQHKVNVETTDLYAAHFKAIADWSDFTSNETNTQYFLAQQAAYQNQQLTTDIAKELEKIAWANHIIFQFPLWWFSTPAVLKGWFDRVLVKGFAYDAGKVFNDGLLKGKTASLVVSTQSPESAYQPDGLHHATLDTFLHHIHHTLRFVGIKPFAPFATYAAFNLDSTQEEKIIADYQGYLKNLIS